MPIEFTKNYKSGYLGSVLVLVCFGSPSIIIFVTPSLSFMGRLRYAKRQKQIVCVHFMCTSIFVFYFLPF